jgi:hypothetical protein
VVAAGTRRSDSVSDLGLTFSWLLVWHGDQMWPQLVCVRSGPPHASSTMWRTRF